MNAEVLTIHHINAVEQQEEWEVARFKKGWVKAWRDTLDEDLASNMCLFALWHWLLLTATYKPTKIIWKGQRREIPPGSVVMSPRELAGKWSCAYSLIWKWLRYLEEECNEISIETCTRGTLVTLRNWNELQNKDEEASTPREHDEYTASTQREHGEILSKESKKEELRNLSLSEEREIEREKQWDQVKSKLLKSYPHDEKSLDEAFRVMSNGLFLGNTIHNPRVYIEKCWVEIRHHFSNQYESTDSKQEERKDCAHKYWDTDPFTGISKCLACKFELARAQ